MQILSNDFFLKEKEDGKLIIMASHNSADIEALCDEVYEMDEGKLVARKVKTR